MKITADFFLNLKENILKILFNLSTLSIFNLNPSIFNKVDWTILNPLGIMAG